MHFEENNYIVKNNKNQLGFELAQHTYYYYYYYIYIYFFYFFAPARTKPAC